MAGHPQSTSAPDIHGPRSSRLVPLRDADHRAVLTAALAARAAGDIPLVGDERWTPAHWDAVVDAVRTQGLPDAAEWATFTSGSAGTPRVVLRTDRSWRVSYPAITDLLDARAGEDMLIPVHPVSSMALYAAAHAETTGLRIRVPAGARLRAADIGGPDGSALMHGTPWHLRDLVDLLDGGAATTLRSVLVGGDRLDPRLAARGRAHGLRVVSYLGAAELSFIAADDGAGLRPLDGVEVELRNGILWVRTEQLALDTVGSGGTLHRDAAGWVSVGDRASLQDGVLTLHGRADDAILTAGATVVPADVEPVLEGLDGVAAALVIGMPDVALGQRVTAYLEPTPGTTLDDARLRAIRAAARDVLARAQLPRRWRVVDALPRTASGKGRRLSQDQAEALTRDAATVAAPGRSPGGRARP